MKLYYSIANRVAYRIYVHGLDHKDKVQECVIKAWRVLGEHPTTDLTPLIYTIMKNHLIWMSRPTYSERKTTMPVPDIAIFARSPFRIVIPLPSSEGERILVTALLANNGNLKVTCSMLGINYWTGFKTWYQAKRAIYEKGYDACFMEEDQCWLRAWL